MAGSVNRFHINRMPLLTGTSGSAASRSSCSSSANSTACTTATTSPSLDPKWSMSMRWLLPIAAASPRGLGPLALKDDRADVGIDPHDGGTSIQWRSTFHPKYPGTGWLYKVGLGRFIQRCVNGLAAHAASVAQADAAEAQR